MKNHIYILTTQYLVLIQGILIEKDDVSSVMCINGGNKLASVSDAYYRFVAKGTGIISKLFKGNSFRVDIDKNIDSGDSWELPVFIAHYFFNKGLLGDGQLNSGDTLTIATGLVKINDRVAAVQGIKEKLFSASDFVKNLSQNGISIRLIFPLENKPDVLSVLEKYTITGIDREKIDFIDSIQWLDEMGTEQYFRKNKKIKLDTNTSRKHNKFYLSSLFFLPLLFLLAYQVLFNIKFSLIGNAPTTPRVVETKLNIWLEGKFKGENSNCTESNTETLKIVLEDQKHFPETSNAQNLCNLDLVIRQGHLIDYKYVLLVNLQTGGFLRLKRTGGHWPIPIPKSNLPKSYALALMSNATALKNFTKFENELDTLSGSSINESVISSIFSSTDEKISILFHKISN